MLSGALDLSPAGAWDPASAGWFFPPTLFADWFFPPAAELPAPPEAPPAAELLLKAAKGLGLKESVRPILESFVPSPSFG